jgi:hypothetical protein
MTIDEYFHELEQAVSCCIGESISNQQYVERLISDSPEKAKCIIDTRKELLCPTDYDQYSGYLEIGWFTEFSSSERLALFSFMFDVGKKLKVTMLRNRFQEYEINQSIFSGDATLFECIRRKKSSGNLDLELINARALENIQGSEIFHRNGYYYKMDPFLNPSIYSFCEENFKESPLFVRLDPTQIYHKHPLFQLNEEILIPANPNWWKNLNIHRKNKEGASYILYPKELNKDSLQEFWEYKINGIRRMDVIAKRNNDGNLSMMIEELSDQDVESSLTIGRCIHLDTDNPIGTPFCESFVNHLDLAINVYEGISAKQRYENNLASGITVEDATFRTHLLRIENIPLKSLILFAISFLQSKTLINDWINDQFLRSEDV